MSVDVEIYVSQLSSYFDKNLNDLKAIITDLSKKEIFYEKIRKKAYQNLEKGEDIILTQNQFYEIIGEINEPEAKNNPFIYTKLGPICMN